jgi:hypothetical protein
MLSGRRLKSQTSQAFDTGEQSAPALKTQHGTSPNPQPSTAGHAGTLPAFEIQMLLGLDARDRYVRARNIGPSPGYLSLTLLSLSTPNTLPWPPLLPYPRQSPRILRS